MELQREYADNGISVTVTTLPKLDDDIESLVQGSVKIEDADGVEPPLTVRTQVPDDYYVDVSEGRILDISELPVEIDLLIGPSHKREDMTIRVEGKAGGEEEIQLSLRPVQVLHIGNKILSDEFEGTDEEILDDIGEYYNPSESLVRTNLRKDIRKYVGFQSYYRILDFLYRIDPHEKAEEHLINSFEKHVVSGPVRSNHGEYHPASASEFEEMLDFYSELENLPSFNKNKISEFKGYINESFAKQAALSGDFVSARDYLSTSVDHFENVGRPEIKKPAVIKQTAIEGLIKESNGDFEGAKEHYKESAREFDGEDAEIYEVWAQLAEVKHHLANEDYDAAIYTCNSISGGDYEYSLVDLRKLNVLVELLEDLEDDEISDGSTIFSKAGMPDTPDKTTDEYSVPRDLIVQYETDYSSAYSVLLSKQQLKKLSRDSIDGESLRSAIVDGITPLGNESSPSKNLNDDTDNKMGVSKEKETQSGLSKTRTRSRDRTFDALDEDDNEEISYESHVEEIQQGTIHHEEALDILEEYLKQNGLGGGETGNSDFIASDGENVLLFEAKSVSSDNETKQIRKAVGQLLEYRYRDIIHDDEFSEMDLTLWLLLAQPPSDTFRQILDSFRDKGIYTLWIQNYEISGLEESLTKLEQITNE